MYRILLVDDEPLMLSTVKRLIDWGKNGCTVVGTASNGTEALEKIEKLRPDVVICDIAMPGISGLDLLKQTEKEFPDTVFIILTNLEEFEIAQESLRHRAVEYLIKTNLEREALEKALYRAIAEREKRSKLSNVEEAVEYFHARQRQEKIRNVVERLLQIDASLPPEDAALLEEEGISRFAFAFIPLNFVVLPEYPNISDEERHEILAWEMEIAERLGCSFFLHVLLFPHSETSFLLFVWGLTAETWESGAAQFRDRLTKTSSQLTRLQVDVVASSVYEDAAKSPAKELSRLEKEYYCTRRSTHSELVGKARKYILDNIDKQIMLQEVAEYVCISPGYLSTLFKKEYNQTMVDFINQTKIDKACALLSENKYRINEIATMLGFENAFYFTRVFRRHTGRTPSEYQTGGGGVL